MKRGPHAHWPIESLRDCVIWNLANRPGFLADWGFAKLFTMVGLYPTENRRSVELLKRIARPRGD